MVVPAKSPVHTVQELIALAKSEPGQLNFGSFGTGSYAHVAMEDFMQRTGIKPNFSHATAKRLILLEPTQECSHKLFSYSR
jgi:tripartite-type tricarboxylate transporter receptor subunit TctC